ncbi:hypothetical protein RN001_000289 [Aquatica leii]|uniref:Zinc finger PHD-type domain-containing protein n=1 Tax=Aquatica leii TaxID=1421715 RepID=A0AAN7PF47_9COLE|nr:hypothetical protein RN001_000289 [Aquatica leii]
MKTAIKSFEKSGIWPPNFNVFTDEDFLPAETTDISLGNPAERTTQETPTAAAAPIPFIKTLEDLPISAINSLPFSEIPKQKRMGSESEESSEDEDAICLYCLDLYSKSTEGWCSCSICQKWVNLSCTGPDSDDDESVLICKLCQ